MTTFTVTNTDDSGAGSLRQALVDAEADWSGGHVIVFDPALAGSVIDLTSGELTINSDNITINGDTDGDGDFDITIERSETNVVQSVLVRNPSSYTVTLANLQLRNADTGITAFAGLVNDGTMTLSNCVLVGQNVHGLNSSTRSGAEAVAGILNSGNLTITSCVLSNITATGGDGGSDPGIIFGAYFGYDGGAAVAGIKNTMPGATLQVNATLFSNITATGGTPGYSDFSFTKYGNATAGWLGGTVSGDAGTTGVSADAGFDNSTYVAGTAAVPASGGGFTLLPAGTVGDAAANTIDGDADANTLFGLMGNDTLNGAEGNDTLVGGSGEDTLNGGDDDDTLWGGAGGDTLNGDAGNDRLVGQAGNDIASGGTGQDQIFGGAGNDRLDGGDDDDRLYGQSDNDTLYGSNGNDRLRGGDGNDDLSGGAGKDNLIGDAGADTFRFNANGFGNDRIADYLPGTDRLVIDMGVFQDTHPAVTTAQQVVDTFGDFKAAGTVFKLDFGGGDSIRIEVAPSFTTAGLASDIFLIT